MSKPQTSAQAEKRIGNRARKQHYVWQHHLRAWTVKGQLWCYRHSEKKLFSSATGGVANGSFFYALERLSPEDLKYVDTLIARAPPAAQEYHRDTVRTFQSPFALRDLLERLSLSPDAREVAEKQLSDLEKTLVESYYAALENNAVRIIDDLRNCRCTFFDETQRAIDFIYFLAQQFVRTPLLRKVVKSLPNPIPGLDLSRTIEIEAHIFASNIGAGIFAERDQYRFTFLKNPTQVPFLTSDQPVINLNTQHDKDLRLYYPLGPKVALIFQKGDHPSMSEERRASPLEIELYNQRIYAKSTDQLYSSDKPYLERFVTTPKNVVAD